MFVKITFATKTKIYTNKRANTNTNTNANANTNININRNINRIFFFDPKEVDIGTTFCCNTVSLFKAIPKLQ